MFDLDTNSIEENSEQSSCHSPDNIMVNRFFLMYSIFSLPRARNYLSRLSLK